MGDGKLRRVAALIILLLIVIQLSACADGLDITPTAGRQAVPVDSLFKEFYQALGGMQVLGPAISSLEIRENLQCQFTERALLCFNQSASIANRFSLYPLGKELGIQEEAPLGVATPPNARLVDGFIIYEKFVPLYDKLYGARYVGKPLTELRINQDLKRAEQFFENVGFYQNLGDPEGPVFLIPYGAYLCTGTCSYRLDEYWSIVKSNLTEQPFAASYARLGGPAVFGSLMLKPQTAPDGNLQQVFENAIFYAPPDNLSQVRLRPLPLLMGYVETPPVEKKSHNELVFYEISDGLGHNVPKPFDIFIALHGGRDLSGRPITEVVKLKDQNLFRQCFENYCLIFNPAAPDSLQVTMEPLGRAYLERYPPAPEEEIQNIFSPNTVSLTISADKPNMNDNEEQYIRMLVQQMDTGQPLERVEGSLILNFPDRPSVKFSIPPTDASGFSVVTIPPQEGLVNGSRLSYQVCLNLPSEQLICALDSYMIWNVK